MIMNRIKPDVDVILDVLKLAQVASPESTFINSLLHQYQERGGLSKKQLEGLHSKASKIKSMPPGKLATIQAIILKKHSNHRSVVSKPAAVEPKEDPGKQLVEDILVKYPQHKRVLFFKMKFDKRETLSATERTELEKFHKLLCSGPAK